MESSITNTKTFNLEQKLEKVLENFQHEVSNLEISKLEISDDECKKELENCMMSFVPIFS